MNKSEPNVKEEKNESIDYCTCGANSIYADTESNSFGYFYRCSVCGKRIDDELHYYNHYDGEDHDDVDLYDY